MTAFRLALAAAVLALPALAFAQGAERGSAPAFGGLGSSRDPIKIDADRLDVFDRESRAVFAGNVVVVQGETTMKCSLLAVSYEPRSQASPASLTAQGTSETPIRKIDCKGPVTIASKTQVATGDSAVFDRVANRVLLTGNVALSDGPNVTRGERIVYDLKSGIANVETAPGGRVRAMFVPGSGSEAGAKPTEAKPAVARPADPKAARRQAP